MQALFKWEKMGHIFNPASLSSKPHWLHNYAQAPNTVVFADFVRVYFSCRPPKDENGQFTSYSAFVDLDKKDLTNIIRISRKPVMNLGQRGCFDEFGIYPFSPLQEENTIIAFYGGWTRCISVPFAVSIGICKSNDHGKTFTRQGKGPVLTSSLHEPCLVCSPRIRKYKQKYYLFYAANSKWHKINNNMEMELKIRLAVSDDALNWKKLNKNLIADKLTDKESQSSPDVIYKNNKYHMFYDYWSATNFRKTKSRSIGYAYSYDLINWTRCDELAGISVSKQQDAFDNEMIAYPHVFEVDDNIYMLYLGNNVGQYGFGLARLEGEL